MYGIPIDKLFDETKEFSIKEAVKQLSNTKKLDKPTIFSQPYDTQDLHKKFPKLLDVEWAKSNDFWWAKENAVSADDFF